MYNRRPEYTSLVDKYEVKQIANAKGIPVIPSYGMWNSFDEIDFNKLPKQFVLKNTHDSGGYIVCKDKSTFDLKRAKKELETRMSRNFYDFGREWPYKNVKPRLLAEKYISILGNPESVEYKITYFNGKVDFITVCRGVPHAELIQRENDFYDRDWNFLPFRTAYYDNSGIENKKPEQLGRMIEVAELMGGRDTLCASGCVCD